MERFFVSLLLICILHAHSYVVRPLRVGLYPVNGQNSIQNRIGPSSRLVSSSSSSQVLYASASTHSSSKWRAKLYELRRDKRQRLYRWCDKITSIFPLWTIAASAAGYKYPHLFAWFQPYVTPALALTMLSMGMTLTWDDFKKVGRSPTDILIGFFAQFSIMPTAAYVISNMMQLPPELAAGLILVGCAPGGTASNLVTLIAGADVALSVLMTLCSTVAAIFFTPYLSTMLAGSIVDIKAKDLVVSTMSVVLAPVLTGLVLNTKAPKACAATSRVSPAISVFLIATICGCVQAVNSIASSAVSVKLLTSICLLHSFGFGLGYTVARLMGLSEKKSRTVSIETGMQNSALAVVLAKHFPNPTLSGLPGAFSATIHSTLGSILAAIWRSHPPDASRPGKWSRFLRDEAGDTVMPPKDQTPGPDGPKPLIPDSLRGSDEGLL